MKHKSLVAAFSCGGALCLFLWFFLSWRWYWAWWGGMSIVTCFAYGVDKWQAKRSGRRIPELALHILAMAGGVMGGWLGRLMFRHKTQHLAFTVVLVVATVLHLAICYWFVRG